VPDIALKPRVLIAGNGSAAWAGIRIALQAADLDVCGEVSHARELAQEVARLGPEVCLVDVALPGGGIRGAAELNERAAGVPVIILTPEIVQEDFLAAMTVGAAGYLPMSVPAGRLPAVVRAVLAGELAVPRPLIPILINHLRDRGARRYLVLPDRGGIELTGREGDVLELLRDGLSTREMADRLLISEVTVRRHIGAVLKKLRVENRSEALSLLQGA